MKTEIVLLAPKGLAYERALSEQISAFTREFQECSVRLSLVDFVELHDRLVANYETLSDKYDVVITLTEWLPELLDRKVLTSLSTFLEYDPPEDWPLGWSKSLLQLQQDHVGNFYGLPYDDGPMLLFYRRDLIEDKKEQEHFRSRFARPLRVPDTWKEFLEVAQHFNRPKESFFGTCLAARPDGHDNVHGFLVQLISRGGRLLDIDMRPAFNSEEGVRGLEFYSDLISKYKVAHPDSENLDSTGVGEIYSQGKIFMAVDWTNVGSLAELHDVSKVIGKTGSWIVPRGDGERGRHASLGIYWILAIPNNSRKKEWSYKFMKFMASRKMDKATSMNGANGSRISTWNDPEIVGRWPFYRTFEKAHEDVELLPQIPEYPAICEVLNDAMESVLRGRKTAKQALDEGARETEAILRH